MNKSFLITILFLFGTFLAIVTLIYYAQHRSNTPDTNSETSTTDLGALVQQKDGVKFSDPKESADFKNMGADVYISGELQTDANRGFSVAYSEVDGSFAIGITAKPLAEYRERASNYLLDVLQISEVEACKLNVYVGVTDDIDPKLAGKNFGLSFCPGSVQL